MYWLELESRARHGDPKKQYDILRVYMTFTVYNIVLIEGAVYIIYVHALHANEMHTWREYLRSHTYSKYFGTGGGGGK